MFGHLGVEWNLLDAGRRPSCDALADVIALHQRFRPLLHTGDVVRFDTEPAYVAHGVYAADRREALVSFAVVATAPSLTPPPLLLPGRSNPRQRYRVERIALPGELAWPRPRRNRHGVPAGAVVTGWQLGTIGLQPPALAPRDGDTDPPAGARVTPLAPATWRL